MRIAGLVVGHGHNGQDLGKTIRPEWEEPLLCLINKKEVGHKNPLEII